MGELTINIISLCYSRHEKAVERSELSDEMIELLKLSISVNSSYTSQLITVSEEGGLLRTGIVIVVVFCPRKQKRIRIRKRRSHFW